MEGAPPPATSSAIRPFSSLDDAQRRALLGALAELIVADDRVRPAERSLYLDFAEWLEIPAQEAIETLDHDPERRRLSLQGLSAESRTAAFVAATMIVLADGELAAAEKRDLALLAASLGVPPAGARAVLRELLGDHDWREHIVEVLGSYEEADRPPPAFRRALKTLRELFAPPRLPALPAPKAPAALPAGGNGNGAALTAVSAAVTPAAPRRRRANAALRRGAGFLLGVGLLAAPGAIPALLVGGVVRAVMARRGAGRAAVRFDPAEYDFDGLVAPAGPSSAES